MGRAPGRHRAWLEGQPGGRGSAEDHAELVWRLLDGRTQQQVADLVGWSRSKVADYARLSGICTDAWKAIVATFDETVTEHDAVVATEIDATATKTRFTENLLRPLSSLHGHQQHQLVKDLAKGKDRRKGSTRGAGAGGNEISFVTRIFASGRTALAFDALNPAALRAAVFVCVPAPGCRSVLALSASRESSPMRRAAT